MWANAVSRAKRIESLNSEDVKEKKSLAQEENWEDIEYRKDHIIAYKLANTPEVKKRKAEKQRLGRERLRKDPEHRKKISKIYSIVQTKKWQDLEWKERQLILMAKALSISPNKPEKLLTCLLNEWLPNEYDFIGDGKKPIAGKLPDFMNIKGQKKLIDLNGDYYHSVEVKGRTKEEEEKQRIDHFRKYGYDILIVWEHELKEDLNILKNRILEFNRC